MRSASSPCLAAGLNHDERKFAGKLKKQSMPQAPGAPPQWVAYNYDRLGRTVSVVTAGHQHEKVFLGTATWRVKMTDAESLSAATSSVRSHFVTFMLSDLLSWAV